MSELLQGMASAIPATLVSVLMSGLLLHYLRRYIDGKLAEEEKRREGHEKVRQQRAELEQRRRRALGRVLFWLHRAVTKPPPNGELEEAWAAYEEVDELMKALDQKVLAEYETGGDH